MVEGLGSKPGFERLPRGVSGDSSDQYSDLRRLVLLPTPGVDTPNTLDQEPTFPHEPVPMRSNNHNNAQRTSKESSKDHVNIGIPTTHHHGIGRQKSMKSEDKHLKLESLTAEESNSRKELRKTYSRNGKVPIKARLDKWSHWLRGRTPPCKYEIVERKLLSEEVTKLEVFDRLRKVYKVPPAMARYDATTPYWSLLRMQGSVVKSVLLRVDFWVLLLLHISLSIYYYTILNHKTSRLGMDGAPTADRWPEASASLVAVPGTFIGFLLVFYNNQCYARYAQQYLHCQFQNGIMSELVLLLRAHVTDSSFPEAKEHRNQLWTLLHAMHLLGYAGLPQQRAENVDIWVWHYAFERKLLTKDQIDRLKPLLGIGAGNLAYKEVMTWLQRRFWTLCRSGRIHHKVGILFSEALWRLRTNIDVLYVMTNGPIPFAYYHLANTIVIVYLVILAYTFIFVSPYYSIAGYILILLALIGIGELTNALADPFGTDETDLPIFDFVNSTLMSMEKLINMPPLQEEEDELPPFYPISSRSSLLSNSSLESLREKSM